MKAARGNARAPQPRPLAAAALAATLAVLASMHPPFADAAAAADPAAPASSLELGFEERVRSENWENVADFDDGAIAAGDVRHQTRFRTRLWERLRLGTQLEFMLGVNNESRRITTPATRFAWDETVVEHLYVDWRPAGSFSARVGRQDLWRGEGLVLGDGGPLDGSRTAYTNALVLGWTAGASKLELIGISNPERDVYIPPIRDARKPMIEWDERALGAYFTRTGAPGEVLEAYYLFKTETGDVRAATHPAFQPDRRLHTLGVRHTRDVAGGWSFVAELAGQAGRQDPDRDLRAWAATATALRRFAVAGRPSLSLAFVGLSGDDASTAKLEGWDPLFARWPRWSELCIYSQVAEVGPSYWTNLGLWRAELKASPHARLDLNASYSLLGAFHPFPGNPAVFAGGAGRGRLARLRADFRIAPQLRGHLVGERLAPGGFYAGDDAAWFFRAEVICSLSRRLAL